MEILRIKRKPTAIKALPVEPVIPEPNIDIKPVGEIIRANRTARELTEKPVRKRRPARQLANATSRREKQMILEGKHIPKTSKNQEAEWKEGRRGMRTTRAQEEISRTKLIQRIKERGIQPVGQVYRELRDQGLVRVPIQGGFKFVKPQNK